MGKMAEERNFRVQFYEKVGLREVEERRALEALLREEPVDGRKLSVWCRRCVVPMCWRPLVWQLLLTVVPRHSQSREYVQQQQRLTYQELWRTIKTLRLDQRPPPSPPHLLPYAEHSRTNGVGSHSTADTPKPHHYVIMWLISGARLLHNPQQQLKQRECQHLLAIVHRMTVFFKDPVEVLHVSQALWDLLNHHQETIIEIIAEATGQLRRDNQMLHQHLLAIGLFGTTVLSDLCLGAFFEVLPDSAVAKVVDKVVTGAVEVLGYVLLTLLQHFRHALMSVNTVEGVASVLGSLCHSDGEAIVVAAFDLWAKLGHPRRP